MSTSSSPSSQTHANHRRFVPLYHFVGTPLLVVYLVWTLWRLVTEPSLAVVMDLVLWTAVLLAFLYARLFALKAQDRVIRLEERLRFERLLEADLRVRAADLSAGQLIALRFASDGELADLVRTVLDEPIDRPAEIKRRIVAWRPDRLRV